MQFIMLHCPYDPDCYTGHRIEPLKSTTYADALIEAEQTLSNRWNRVKWEYRIIGIAHNPAGGSFDTGCQLHEFPATNDALRAE